MKKTKVLITHGDDPWFNLATEDWIFRDMDPETKILFLWRNRETVVIGRFQNPWVECNLAQMEKDGVLLTRRQSGGGAVYQDHGNTNFTFLTGRADYDKAANMQILSRALARFGVKAYASGRNDMLAETSDGAKKISGSAFKETKDRCFHHGTLLINVDLTKLANYLNPDPKKLESKGIASVRARVANISSLTPEATHDSLTQAIIEEFFKYWGEEGPIIELGPEDLNKEPKLLAYYEKLKDWNWRFGETPQFTHHLSERFEWGGIDIHLDSHKGLIERARVFSDTIYPELIETLEEALPRHPYGPEGLRAVMGLVRGALPEREIEIAALELWLLRALA
jgi:lipoate-protein ligase A